MDKENIKHLVMHHLAAFGKNDLDEILTDYTPDSVLLTPTGPLRGMDQIRQFFSDYFVVIPSGSTFEIKQMTVVDNVTYIAWSSASGVADIPMGTDTFIIDGGKILIHTVTDYRISK